MDERNCAILVRLTEKEKKTVLNKSKLCGLKMEPFIRKLIMGVEVKARPPNEYVQLIREINAIGKNINQIARVSNMARTISQDDIDMVKKNQNEIMRLVKGLR